MNKYGSALKVAKLFLVIIFLTSCISYTRQPASIFWEEGKIAFFSTQKINEDNIIKEKAKLYLMNIPGDEIVYVEDVNPILTYRVAWSPDGKFAAFVSYDEQANSICLMIKTQHLYQCVDIDGRTASWSQNSKWLVSHHKAKNGEMSALYLIEINTGFKQKLVDLDHSDNDIYSSWSSDNQWIAYDNYSYDKEGEIWLTNLEGNTRFLIKGTRPDWSPNTNEIAFVRDGKLWVYNLDNNRERLIVNELGNVASPDWAPNGKSLLFTLELNGNNDIYRVDSDGNNLKNITNSNAIYFYPTWIP